MSETKKMILIRNLLGDLYFLRKTRTHTKFLFGVIPFSRTKSVGTNNIFLNGQRQANNPRISRSPYFLQK
jgi:hypothetical protein